MTDFVLLQSLARREREVFLRDIFAHVVKPVRLEIPHDLVGVLGTAHLHLKTKGVETEECAERLAVHSRRILHFQQVGEKSGCKEDWRVSRETSASLARFSIWQL